MSLFGSIHLAGNALSAAQLGLQVVGNNLANVNTPGYIREEVIFQPAPPHRVGRLVLGLGVEVDGIIQRIDRLLAERLHSAQSDLANGEAQQSAYVQLEALLGELSDADLSTSLSNFFASIHDILNQPEDVAVRNLAVRQGLVLADDIRRLDRRARDLHDDINQRILDAADTINRLLRRIAELNLKVVTIEGGGSRSSNAVGLRDERQKALDELAALLDIRTVEQPSGSVSVFAEGDYLVVDGTFREVTAVTAVDPRGLDAAEIRIAETDVAIPGVSGQLAGLTTARDEIVGGFLDQLDDLARSLIFEFNKVYASGQGTTGYTDLTSEFSVDDAAAALDQAGLPFTPVSGSFQLQVRNQQTGLTQTVDFFVQLNGLDGDTTLADLAAALDSLDGISAAASPSGSLTITSDSSTVQFTFANDTSGVLAALGLNTFFSGSGASEISVRPVVRDDPTKFATSRNGIGADTEVAAELAGLLDAPLESQNGASLTALYEQLAGEVTQGAAASRAVAEGFRTFKQTLESQHLAISGVNLDEEAVRMITFQRAFQASARFISAVSQLLETLVKL